MGVASTGICAPRMAGVEAHKELRALARRSKDVKPERRLVFAGGGHGRHESGRGGEDRRHGPPDAARLGPPLQRWQTATAAPAWPAGLPLTLADWEGREVVLPVRSFEDIATDG